MFVGSSSGAHSTIGTTTQASSISGLAHHPHQQTDEELSEFVCESVSYIVTYSAKETPTQWYITVEGIYGSKQTESEEHSLGTRSVYYSHKSL